MASTTRRSASSSSSICRRRRAACPQIEVTFDIDANGIVHVSAKDRATDKDQSMTITGQSTLDKDVIDQMVKDAEAHAEEDKQRLAEAEARNNADSLVYQTEKVLRDQGERCRRREGRGRSAARRPQEGARGQRPRRHQDGDRGAHGRQPGVQPEALRGSGQGRVAPRSSSASGQVMVRSTTTTSSMPRSSTIRDRRRRR